jgi:hypothetical protein
MVTLRITLVQSGNFSECLNPCFQPDCLHFLCTMVAFPQNHDLLLRVQVWTWALLPSYPMHFLTCFVCLCLIASATTLHYTTIYLAGGNVCDFTTLNLQYFSCLCVCNALLKYIVWSSNSKKNLGIGWESKSRSMEIWRHDFFCSEF